MFLEQDALRERFGVVSGKDWDSSLGNDWTGVELGRYIVHRASVFLARLGQRPLVRMQSAQFWQQGWMNIENAPAPSVNEIRAQDSHEPGQTDDFDASRGKLGMERRLERRPPGTLRKSIAFAATPASRAATSPGASGLSDTTSEISAENSGSWAASIRALMLDPRPEMRMAVRTRSVKEKAFHG